MVAASDNALIWTITPSSRRYEPDDDRWSTQLVELFSDLRREVGGLRREAAAQAGQKGATETITLALASAGSITAAVQCLRDWLTRDRTRVVEISYAVDGREERIVLRGTHLDDATAKQVTDVALSRWRNQP
jgi:Effector Associated Constant Component 1